MRRNQCLLVGVISLFAASGLWLYFGIRRAPGPDSGDPRVIRAEEPLHQTSQDPTDPVDQSHNSSERRSSVDPTVSVADRSHEPVSVDANAKAGLGHLRVRAVDAETRLDIDRIRVRAMNETRLADRQADRDGEGVELSLSPGTYSILVMAKGYESSEFPAQSIEAEKTTALDSVALHPGSATILGSVTGDTWAPDTLWVELVGDGRRPCPACVDGTSPASKQPPRHGERWSREDYCARCGYGKSSSRLPVPPDGRFVFDRLTSGPYAVRLMDVGERTLCDPKTFELVVGQSFPLEIRFGAPRRVRVEIVDTDGASLAPEWAARLRREAADDEIVSMVTIREAISNRPVDFHCQFRTEHLQIGTSAFTPPPPDPNGIFISGTAAFGARKLGPGGRHDRDDRPRGDRDDLWPEFPPANVPLGYFPSEVDPDGFVRFDSVPSLELTLTMTCERFTATTAVPASRDEVRLQANLRLTENTKTSTEGAESIGAQTFREYELQRAR
jgi:hypothetical protein